MGIRAMLAQRRKTGTADTLKYTVYSSRLGRLLRCRTCGVQLFGEHDPACSA